VKPLDNIIFALKPSLWLASTQTGTKKPITLDPWQSDLLNDRSDRIHANTSRQIGKSTVVSAKVWHRAIFGYEALILLIAPTLRQSVELIRKVKEFARTTSYPQDAYRAGALTIEVMPTRSRIVALPGGNPDNIRGFSGPSMVVIDEASFAKDQLYRSIRPMLMTSNGQIVLISTPFTKTGFFWEIASKTDEELGETWSRYTVPAWESPRVSKKFLDSERKAMGDWWYMSEYGCAFQDPEDSLLASEMIQAAFRHKLPKLYEVGTDAESLLKVNKVSALWGGK